MGGAIRDLETSFLNQFDKKYRTHKICLITLQYSLINDDFLWVLNNICQEFGIGWESCGFSFPNNCEIGDDDYFENGVMFYFRDNEEIINYNIFTDLLETTCNIYILQYPEKSEYVNNLLSLIKNKYKIF